MKKIDNSKYIYGGYIEYKGRKIVLFFDTDVIENVFFEEVNRKYKELDKQTKNYFDSIFNHRDGIVYKHRSIKKIIMTGLTAITITLFASDNITIHTSLQRENPHTYKQINIDIEELSSSFDDELNDDVYTESNITNDKNIEFDITLEKELAADIKEILNNNDTPTTNNKGVSIANNNDLPIENNNYIPTTNINSNENNNIFDNNEDNVGAYIDNEQIEEGHQIQTLNGLTALGFYYNVDDILTAINTNPNLNDDKKKAFLSLEEFFRSNPYIDYNTVGVNLNTVNVEYINDPTSNIGGSYNCNQHLITIYDNEAFYHEAIHSAFRSMNTYIITSNDNGETIKKEVCRDNKIPPNLASNQSVTIEYNNGLSNGIYGRALNDGMVKLFEQEFTDYRDNIYKAECLTTQILCELVGKDVMLKGFSTNNPDLIVEKLSQIYNDEQTAKSLLIMISNYSNAYYFGEGEIIYNTLLEQVMNLLITLYRKYIEQNIDSNEISSISLYKVMQNMDQIVKEYLPKKAPLFNYLYNNTKQEYSLNNKDFDIEFKNETGLDIHNISNLDIGRHYYGKYKNEGYILSFDNESNILDFITINPENNNIKSR